MELIGLLKPFINPDCIIGQSATASTKDIQAEVAV